MSSKGGGTALTRRNYRLASDTDKPRSTGIVNEKLLSDYLHHVFPPSTNQGPALASLRKPLGFQDLGAHLEKLLSEGEPAEDSRGKPVVLDHTSGFEGLLFVDDDLLGVIGHSNFSSIRATTCVYKGKWAYEVLISSQGLMQIGWCTLNCRFNQEEGVGDTPDSYAYDGNRVRKWNVTTTNYGKSWAAGDIVSCLIDLDEGTITFCLLSFKESVDPVKCVSCWLCFSLTVVTYPVEGYLPLQNPPTADLMKANKLLGFIKTVLSTSIDTQEERLLEREFTGWRLHGEPTVLITLAHIFNHFAPLMCKVYLVEDVLMNFLLGILEGGGSVDEHPLIQQLLDLFWLLMEDYEIHYLRLTTAVLNHEKSRKYLLNNVLYPPNTVILVKEAGLEELIPTTWWPTHFDKEGKDEREPSDESADERLRRRAYERGCQRLKKRIEVVEELQVQILKLLLNNKDKTTGEASRYIFLNKFRKFLQENASNRGYMVCFLHRLITAVRMSWDEGRRQSEEAYVPPQLFYNGKVDYFDLQRLGGLLKANIIIDPAEIQASSMDDLDEDEESGAAQRVIPDANERVIPDANERVIPDANEGVIPDANEGVIPDANERVIPDTNERVIPNANERVIPDANERVIPDANERVIPDANERVIPDANEGVIPDANERVIPDANERVIPDTNERVIPDANERVIPDTNERVIPDANERVIPDTNEHVIPNECVIPDTNERVIPDANERVIPDANERTSRPFGAAVGGALARPSWLSSPTLGRANRFLSTAAVSLMTPRRPLSQPEKVKVRTLAVEQRTEDDIEGSHGNDGLLLGRPMEEPEQPIADKSLLEIVDGIQLGKMVVVSDDVHEYAVALKDTEEKIARCPAKRADILDELQKSQKVFSEKLNHLSRRLAWINATIYSKEKMLDVYWLLCVCIRTIEHADNTGSLFAFAPEFYLNVAMNAYSALKNYFSPANSMEELPGYEETLTQLAAILAKHFADPRIVGTDIKDSLMQALASYVCYPQSLRAVERIPEEHNISPSNISPSNINISPSNISPSNISPSNISTSNISPSNISTSNISPRNISPSNISPSNISTSNISPRNISPSNISTSNISPSNISPSNISPSNISPSNINVCNELIQSVLCRRVAMMRNLLAPYEQRPWAQTNWILVRLWRGCGFGYRYTRLPHLLKTKPEDANLPSLQRDLSVASFQKPCPSLLLQRHMAELLSVDKEMAASFLNSVLNQLNWAFSEFIGMIQEIQQAAERPERNFVDTRQLKVCATCFDLSVSLLRVLEMTVTLVPEIFLDWTRPSAELLLRRLAQSFCCGDSLRASAAETRSGKTHLDADKTHLDADKTHLDSVTTHLDSDKTHLDADKTHLNSVYLPGLDPTVCRASAAETRSDKTHLDADKTHLNSDKTHLDLTRPSAELLLRRLAQFIFLDWTRLSAELLLRRLAQVLNRVTAEKNLFDRVVNLRLPGLESVDHYPILVAVTGILVRVLVDGDRQGCFLDVSLCCFLVLYPQFYSLLFYSSCCFLVLFLVLFPCLFPCVVSSGFISLVVSCVVSLCCFLVLFPCVVSLFCFLVLYPQVLFPLVVSLCCFLVLFPCVVSLFCFLVLYPQVLLPLVVSLCCFLVLFYFH
ncbi:E3 ubiquitin-protein ligase RNF123 [Dissostichus eleginoides]|uniref:E3 ubiquitin-protein ligase RNF123 n=1 Tax=Dissostichus eleginoides TaxID=100907 RepID=A0AAD9CGS9_DISEL|nr:E3 ubiquitin-protein ligase RNF123 [Dissostichus eleginoides]